MKIKNLKRILRVGLRAAKKEYVEICREKEHVRLHKIWSKKWNSDLDWIMKESEKDEKGYFYWDQLVRQEIEMWASLTKKVNMKEINDLSRIRGFNEIQKQYLIDHLKNMKLLED